MPSQLERDACVCGRPKTVTQRYCRLCKRRWVNAGCPDSGPPAAMPWRLERDACQCGRPKTSRQQYCLPCRRRWVKAGCPDSGPPPAMDRTQIASIAAKARAAKDGPVDAPDTYDAEWYSVIEPQRRWHRATAVAADLARCVASRDDAGAHRLLTRHAASLPAVLVALGWLADPAAYAARRGPTTARRMVWLAAAGDPAAFDVAAALPAATARDTALTLARCVPVPQRAAEAA